MEEKARDKVFISYASDNLPMVRRIVEGLIKRNLEAWFDKEQNLPGKWKQRIKKAIAQSRYFVICISQAALTKTGSDIDKVGFQDEELNTAFEIAMSQPETEFTIVPLRLEDCERGDFRISSYQQYDMFDDFENGLDLLAVRLGGISLADNAVKDERTVNEIKVDAIIGKALSAYYSRDFVKFLNLTELALDIQPNNYKLWMDKGAALGNLRKHEASIKAYDEAIRINQNEPKAWFSKGVSYAYLNKHSQALKAFDKAIKIDPFFADAWADKGLTLMVLDRHEDALKASEKSLEIKQNFSRGWSSKGVILHNLGRFHDAIKSFNKALKFAGFFVDPRILYNKGIALQKIGQFKDAYEAYDIATKIMPNLPECLFNKGAMLCKLNRYEEALSSFEKSRKINPDIPGIWRNIALIYLKQKKFKEALKAYEKAVEQEPNDKINWNNKAAVHYELGQADEAILCCDMALKIDPNLQAALSLKQKLLSSTLSH